jgi:hypothetical protein
MRVTSSLPIAMRGRLQRPERGERL